MSKSIIEIREAQGKFCTCTTCGARADRGAEIYEIELGVYSQSVLVRMCADCMDVFTNKLEKFRGGMRARKRRIDVDDIVGETFNGMIVTAYVGDKEYKKSRGVVQKVAMYECKCLECGRITTKQRAQLKNFGCALCSARKKKKIKEEVKCQKEEKF